MSDIPMFPPGGHDGPIEPCEDFFASPDVGSFDAEALAKKCAGLPDAHRSRHAFTFADLLRAEALADAAPVPRFEGHERNGAAKRDVARAIQQLAEHFGISEAEAAEVLLAACLQPKRPPTE